MHFRLGDGLGILVDCIADVSGVYNIQKNATEEGQNDPCHSKADRAQDCCFLYKYRDDGTLDKAWQNFWVLERQAREKESLFLKSQHLEQEFVIFYEAG